mmetsp:Transcript_16664/g.65081  ORF Transcript_16664/g.65081 Transcript_16664/m.65081 type:complete len:961 (-) Transcript_16664:40-2922(-)
MESARGDLGVSRDVLCSMLETSKMDTLQGLGGVEGLAAALHTDLKKGLPTDDPHAAEREERFGTNFIAPKPPKSIWYLMWMALQDFTLVMLIVSAVISLVLGMTFEDPSTGWIEGTAILVSVVIVVVVAAGNDYAKELQFVKLNAQVEDSTVAVVRGGRQQEVSIRTIVVGDVVELAVGDILPADGILIQGHDLRTDESSLTGETDFIKKNAAAPFLLSGTQLMQGGGSMLVLAVGKNSQAGIIKTLVSGSEHQDDEEAVSVLGAKLEVLAQQIGYVGSAFATVCVLLLAGRFGYNLYSTGQEWHSDYWLVLLGYLITGITILVVAVPEGLPLAVTLSLAFSVQKMQVDKNLVKHLDACETMGSATTICSDKTGTLTTNRMTVMRAYIGGKLHETRPKEGDVSAKVADLLCTGISINSTGRLEETAEGGCQQIGNKTECALLQLAKDLGHSYESTRAELEKTHVFTFSSDRKRMSTLVPLPDGGHRLFVKGASEIILERCQSSLREDGSTAPLGISEQVRVNTDAITAFAQDGLRTLTLAYRDFDAAFLESILRNSSLEEKVDLLECKLTFVAVVGIEDPVRDEVPAAIEKCRRAGITVRMVTGDNVTTARSIARKCGLVKEGDGSLIMEGPQFRKRVVRSDGEINQEEFDRIWPKLRVMARSSPTDKYVLVSGIMNSKAGGEDLPVVAVTGDGTNDAPALKKANVGFAMGIAGTAVAKDACDIILLDDNFNSIVKAVMWGRNVYDSISKFLQFQLTVNLVALTTAFASALMEYGTPLTAVQLLWVNLIMDSFAALALATEPPSITLLERKPYGRFEAMISKTMWRNILAQAAFQLVVQYVILCHPALFAVVPHSRLHHTISFNAFVFCQLFNEFNSRRIGNETDIFRGVFDNPLFVLIIAITFVTQVVFVQFGGSFTQCAPLSWEMWLFCIGVGALSIPFGFVYRAIPVQNTTGKAKLE